MRIDIITVLPGIIEGALHSSILKRAQEKGLVEFGLHNLRDYTLDKHKRVDDYPFGGGAGMLLAPQPLFDCFRVLEERYTSGQKCRSVYMTPAGKPLTQQTVRRFSEYDVVNILCGHYEGVDQRVLDRYVDEEISIGDYVLTGGELPAMVLMDGVMRYVPGVLSNDESTGEESFSDGLLEYPQYTRPAEFRRMKVPQELLTGNHQIITSWQREQALKKTLAVRPDLLEEACLSEQDRKILEKYKKQT